MDKMDVQAETVKGVSRDVLPALKAKLEGELKSSGLRSVVQMVEPDQLESTEFKAKRVIDKRALYDEIIRQG